MTLVAIRRVAFVTALFCLPLPFAIVEHGWVPAAWLVAVAALTTTATLTQGGTMGALLARYLVLEAALLVAACWLTARVLAWATLRLVPDDRRTIVVVVGVALAFLVAFIESIFRTTAVASGQSVPLLRLFAG